MTSSRNLPVLNHHECSRFVKATQIDDGRVSGVAFRLKEGEPFLSVNCVDFHDGGSREDRIQNLRKFIFSKFNNIRTQVLALFQVGNTIEYVRKNTDDKRELAVAHEWEEDDHSHCGVHGFLLGEDIVADLMAETVSPEDVFPVKIK